MSYPKKDYKLIDIIPSSRKNKKYKATIKHYTGETVSIHFGDSRYQQYKDKIGHYSHLDHNDKERRKRFRARHKYNKDEYSPTYFSWTYLW